MVRKSGKSVYKGFAYGKIHVLKKNDHSVQCKSVDDVELEVARVYTAIKQAGEELQLLYEKALAEVGEENAMIFQVHQMMLEDEDYLESIEEIIRTEQVNGEYAVSLTGKNFAEMFAGMDDEYMKARSADVKDITERIIKCLNGDMGVENHFSEPVIIVADDLAPSETISLDKEKILAFVTVHGSANSHTAILARMMNIPALVCVEMDLEKIKSGTEAAVNGVTGDFYIEPSAEVIEQICSEREKQQQRQLLLKELTGKETVTKSGKKVKLYANVGGIGDLDYVLENDAEGIGLFRSEFLYLGRKALPTEEEQFNVYKQVAQKMNGKKVIIRTLDIGADKQADYLELPEEENPALGYRAIRICLTQPDIFKTQLRALYRAAVYGNISIMYPMIISIEEIERIKKISAEVKQELKKESVPFKDVEEGIMIETPAAVMICDELAKMVDFFSIGTNDLTQYTLAIDRQNAKLDTFYNSHHPAILKMIKMVADNAHKEGIWVGICGELGADMSLTEEFVKMGIDELSVSPGAVLGIREIIRLMD